MLTVWPHSGQTILAIGSGYAEAGRGASTAFRITDYLALFLR